MTNELNVIITDEMLEHYGDEFQKSPLKDKMTFQGYLNMNIYVVRISRPFDGF